MTTYRTIASTETDADSPVTVQLMTALADNPNAIAEGASGAPRVVSPALDLTFKTGSSAGAGTVVTLDTTDLSNLADMTLALVTGTVEAQPSGTITTTITCNVSTPSIILRKVDSTQETHSFSHLIELSSDTSITLTFGVSGSGSASAYGQILILGR